MIKLKDKMNKYLTLTTCAMALAANVFAQDEEADRIAHTVPL